MSLFPSRRSVAECLFIKGLRPFAARVFGDTFCENTMIRDLNIQGI